MKSWIRLHPSDNVVVALRDLAAGERIGLELPDGGQETIVLKEEVAKGHKVLIRPAAAGEDVIKFGYSIGKAKVPLEPGVWVHHHNVRTGLSGKLEYRYEPGPEVTGGSAACVPEGFAERTFAGYVRENGDVGIRNELWILNTVGCINKTCETLARMGNDELAGRVDGVYHFAHPYGCSQLGDDLKHTQAFLSALALHPNAGGVLVVGLGCENNQIDEFRTLLGDFPEGRIRFMRAQDEADELEKGMELLEELAAYAETFKREPVPVSRLKIGLKCGGSDGLSGITANPLVGRIADAVTAAGGTALLTEVPEMFGAETILMNRAADAGVFERIVRLINDFKQYFIDHGQEIYENPSPGNKAGGISTLEEKSLGCTQKGGHAVVTDVLPYGTRASRPGLNLVQAPGNDLVSVSALAAAGAQIVLFTTGRGTPFGGPVPTMKLSTNSELAARKANWIDFDAGRLLDEAVTMDSLAAELLDFILDIASGNAQTKNERTGFREIAIFKDGVIL
ncbi:altronate dehydratase family protein [Paenibacillus cisolokensis]